MKHPKNTHLWFAAVSSVVAGALMTSFGALAMEDKLVVVTSYPPDTTVTVKKAFEAKHPGAQVEMLKKKTTEIGRAHV